MKIGLVGKPNVGKSTFFKAATLKDVAVADYPFTTIEPNVGVAYLRTPCPDRSFEKQCTPAHGDCRGGTRFVPIELVDVAGLVPGAHEGRGLGNKFLDDLRRADALIHIVDASGSTDAEGAPVAPGTRDPLEDVRFLEEELVAWLQGILGEDWGRLMKRVSSGSDPLERVLAERLAGLGMTERMIHAAMREAPVDLPLLARAIRRISKPLLVAFNKSDKVPKARMAELAAGLDTTPVQATAADAEVALRGAAKHELIRYEPGGGRFEFTDRGQLTAPQIQALEYIDQHVLREHGTTGVLPALEQTAYELLNLIVVYPVEDETHLTDKKGRVLPDAFLVPKGATARDLAYKVHTDLGEHFIRAIDAKSRRVIGAAHELAMGDVVKIVSSA